MSHISTAMTRTAGKLKSANVCLWGYTALSIAPAFTWTVLMLVLMTDFDLENIA